MIRSAVTISLVQQARGGPFVFWDDLEGGMHRAAELGFDAVEIFAPSPDHVHRDQLRKWCDRTRLQVAAVGTGAGWLIHKLTLTDPDAVKRSEAVKFVERMIDFGAEFGAPAIIGSIQGRAPDSASRPASLSILAQSLSQLSEHAASRNVRLIYEPLNRYETNLCNTLEQGQRLIRDYELKNVVLLADLFHMNIEEVCIPAAIRAHADVLGHIHFVDSNRRAAGYGHLDFAAICQAVRDTGFSGYMSAEVLALPDSDSAARQTMQSLRCWFKTGKREPGNQEQECGFQSVRDTGDQVDPQTHTRGSVQEA